MTEPTKECPAWIYVEDERMLQLFEQVVADCMAHERRLRENPPPWQVSQGRVNISDRH